MIQKSADHNGNVNERVDAVPAFDLLHGQHPYVPEPVKYGESDSVFALILGIIAIISSTCLSFLFGCFGFIPSLVIAVVGLVIANKNTNTAKQIGIIDSKASAARVLCIVAIILGSFLMILSMISIGKLLFDLT